MATREENLKKINDELEKLSDDELDKIAGGVQLYNNIHEPGEPDVKLVNPAAPKQYQKIV